MEFQVETSLMALMDAEEAYLWIQKRAPLAAARWYKGLSAAINSLEDNPRRCSIAPESDAFKREIRQLLYGKRQHKFRILFTVSENTVRIIRIRRGARKFLEP